MAQRNEYAREAIIGKGREVSSQPCSMGKPEDKLLFIKPRSKAWITGDPEFSKGSIVTFVEGQDGGRSWCSPKWVLVVMGMENVEIMDARWKCSMSGTK